MDPAFRHEAKTFERLVREVLANDGEVLRAWLTQHAPVLLHGVITDTPLWVLVLLAVFVGFVLVSALVKSLQQSSAGMVFVWKFITRPWDAAREAV